eukprot:scaffold2858_cov659-Pavlova_lutheri.AAC.24
MHQTFSPAPEPTQFHEASKIHHLGHRAFVDVLQFRFFPKRFVSLRPGGWESWGGGVLGIGGSSIVWIDPSFSSTFSSAVSFPPGKRLLFLWVALPGAGCGLSCGTGRCILSVSGSLFRFRSHLFVQPSGLFSGVWYAQSHEPRVAGCVGIVPILVAIPQRGFGCRRHLSDDGVQGGDERGGQFGSVFGQGFAVGFDRVLSLRQIDHELRQRLVCYAHVVLELYDVVRGGGDARVHVRIRDFRRFRFQGQSVGFFPCFYPLPLSFHAPSATFCTRLSCCSLANVVSILHPPSRRSDATLNGGGVWFVWVGILRPSSTNPMEPLGRSPRCPPPERGEGTNEREQ